jgi:cation-transporting ATPase E
MQGKIISGLTEREVQARRRRGEGNTVGLGPSRSYFDIARANLFTFFNNILFTIGVGLVVLGRMNDALTSVGLGLVNAVISTVQELRAKRKLDRIALVTRPAVTVVRDGEEKPVDPADLVRGDILHVRGGDQIVADGPVIGEGRLEMDESLLTGESDTVSRQAGDTLFSGSFCVAGNAYYEIEKIGTAGFASQLTTAVRRFEWVKTPLQKEIDFAVRVVMLLVALMGSLILLAAVLVKLPFIRLVQISAVLTGQVPYGLFFMIVVAYAMGAAAMAKQGALAQQVNAIESLSNVDVLCLDKTGTLTTNRLVYQGVQALGGRSGAEVERLLGDFARSASVTNRTSEAIIAACRGEKRAPLDEVLFTSSRKWSALSFAADEQRGVYVLGAMEMLKAYLPAETMAEDALLPGRVKTWSEAGLRVLVFAHNPGVTALRDEKGQPLLPTLTPLGVIGLADELRPGARETLAEFGRLGIRIKMISGDDPQAVAALAKQAGVVQDIIPVSGLELDQMSEDEFNRAAVEATVFGRISPRQKAKIVDSLIARGDYVAMTGDGVNDVLALKKAKLGIAMQSGSNATRNVADMVLLNDSFAALPSAFQEGKRIVSGMASAMYLFLTRVATTTLMIIAISMIGLGFPFEPAHVALTVFTVGIPSFFLIRWAKPQARQVDLLPSLLRFVLPAAILTMLFGVALYTFYYTRVLEKIDTYQIPPQVIQLFEEYTGLTYAVGEKFKPAAASIVAQTVLSIFISFTAFLLIFFLEPPVRFFTGWTRQSPDKRPALLALGLFLVFGAVMLTPDLAYYFALFPVGRGVAIILGIVIFLWVLALRTIWRTGLFAPFFTLPRD